MSEDAPQPAEAEPESTQAAEDARKRRRIALLAGFLLGPILGGLLTLAAQTWATPSRPSPEEEQSANAGDAPPPEPAIVAAAAEPDPPCIDQSEFNAANLAGQRAALAACGFELAEVETPPPAPAPAQADAPAAPAWCADEEAFAQLLEVSGDPADALAACGVSLPTTVEQVVNTETVPCPDPAAFNAQDATAQRASLTQCGLTLVELPRATAAPAAAPPPSRPTGDSGACSATNGPPCTVTLTRPQSLGFIADTYYGDPRVWCWIYDNNKNAFDSESRPELVRGDPNCVYAGDSFRLETLPEDWGYGPDCAHKQLLAPQCPRSALSETEIEPAAE